MSSFSLFDVIGPIMHGPSSNHTGGAVRLGYYANQIIGGTPKKITFAFHPLFMKMFTGHRTHIALMAGCLGMREDDKKVNDAKSIIISKKIKISYKAVREKNPDRNIMRISGNYDGLDWVINGISVGGGNIVIDSINGISTKISGNSHIYFYRLQNEINLKEITKIIKVLDINGLCDKDGYSFYFSTLFELPSEDMKALEKLLAVNIVLQRHIKPLHVFSEKVVCKPLFTTFKELEKICQGQDIAEAAITYEMKRSKTSRTQILHEAMKIVEVEESAIKQGLKGNANLIGGFIGNSDGKLAQEWSTNNHSIAGNVLNMAMARALAVSSINACAGIVVATPTCGSSGTLPGTLFTVAERYGKSHEVLAKAFLVAAALGTIVGNKSSFSGSIGGCQVEIGVAAAIGAGASVWLAGGTTDQIFNAFCLAMKNLLGLTCDQPVSPVEIPCVKRNAMGAAVAIMGAELALAGIKSSIKPDEVVDALVDTANRIPSELRATCIGGLASVKSAKKMQKSWNRKLALDKTL